jgi:hypothetical protein
MRTGGDQDNGFRIDRDLPNGIVRARAWGFWPLELAQAFVGAIQDECKFAMRATLSLDATKLKPQREVAIAELAAALRAAVQSGVIRVVIHTENPLTRLQLTRIASDAEIKHLVEIAPAKTG